MYSNYAFIFQFEVQKVLINSFLCGGVLEEDCRGVWARFHFYQIPISLPSSPGLILHQPPTPIPYYRGMPILAVDTKTQAYLQWSANQPDSRPGLTTAHVR